MSSIKRLHIAKFTNVYLPMTNGIVTSVVAFRAGLTARGHVVFVFAPHAAVEYTDAEPFVFRYPSMELPLQKYPLAWPVSGFVDKLLPRLKLDVIHANHPAILGRVAVRKSRSLGVPLVFTYHTRYLDYSHYLRALPEPMVKEFLEHWLAHFLSKCHHVVVPSQSIRRLLEEAYGISKRVSVVATGVDRSQFGRLGSEAARTKLGLSQTERIVLSVGRLAREKNWEMVLRAFQASGACDRKVRLLIIGRGDDRENLEDLSRELGVADQVTFAGQVPYEEIPDYLSAGDVFLFASVTETQGLVTLEAMASGLPVVAVEASGTREMVTDGNEGFLTEADAPALGARLALVLNNHELRARMGKAASLRSGAFDIAAQASRMEAVYRVAMADYASGYRVPVEKEASTSRWRDFLAYFKPQPDIGIKEVRLRH